MVCTGATCTAAPASPSSPASRTPSSSRSWYTNPLIRAGWASAKSKSTACWPPSGMAISVSTSRSLSTVRPVGWPATVPGTAPTLNRLGRLSLADLVHARFQVQRQAEGVIPALVGGRGVPGEAIGLALAFPQRQLHAGKAALAAVLGQVQIRVQVDGAGDPDRQRLLLQPADRARRPVAFAAGVVRRQVQPGAGQIRIVAVAELGRLLGVVVVGRGEAGGEPRPLELDAGRHGVDAVVERLRVAGLRIVGLDFVHVDGEDQFVAGPKARQVDGQPRRTVRRPSPAPLPAGCCWTGGRRERHGPSPRRVRPPACRRTRRRPRAPPASDRRRRRRGSTPCPVPRRERSTRRYRRGSRSPGPLRCTRRRRPADRRPAAAAAPSLQTGSGAGCPPVPAGAPFDPDGGSAGSGC